MENQNGIDTQEQLETIDGSVENVIYHNDENGYSVCDLETENGELITIVGNIPVINEGEIIRAMGRWVTHPSFGRQFKVEVLEKQLPMTSSAIQRYLSSRAIKGIGPKLAEKIVGRYGADTFDVIENHPEWLAELPGISHEKARAMSEDFKEQFGVRAVMMFCRDFFGPDISVRIYKKWGASAVDRIKENPYILCDEINGIGFERADGVARSLGVAKNSPYRIKSGIKCVLNLNGMQEGHVYIPESKLAPATARMLSVSEEEAASALEALIEDKQLIRAKIGQRNVIYLDTYYNAESFVAGKLDMLDKLCPKLDMSDIERFITQIELENGIKYDTIQKKAIENSINSGVMILTGGPGTGKSATRFCVN